EIFVFVVCQAPLARLLVNHELPLARIGEVDIQRVISLWHNEATHIEIGVGMELRGGIGARPPHRISRVLPDSPVLAEQLADTAVHLRRTVGYRDCFASNGL